MKASAALWNYQGRQLSSFWTILGRININKDLNVLCSNFKLMLTEDHQVKVGKLPTARVVLHDFQTKCKHINPY